MPKTKENRRDFLKKIAYVAPVILSMEVVPTFASIGSGTENDKNPIRKNAVRKTAVKRKLVKRKAVKKKVFRRIKKAIAKRRSG